MKTSIGRVNRSLVKEFFEQPLLSGYNALLVTSVSATHYSWKTLVGSGSLLPFQSSPRRAHACFWSELDMPLVRTPFSDGLVLCFEKHVLQ